MTTNGITTGEGQTRPGYGGKIHQVLQSGVLAKGSGVSFNPALERDVLLETSDDEWAHTLHNSIADVQIGQYKGELIDKQNELNTILERIDNKNYSTDFELAKLQSDASDIKRSMNPLYEQLNEAQQDKDLHYIPSIYQYDTYRQQAEENSNALKYLVSGEFAEDLGGSLSELKTQVGLYALQAGKPLVKKAVTGIAEKMAVKGVIRAASRGNAYTTAAMLLYDSASLIASAISTYQMRRRETLAEKSDYYEQRLNKIILDLTAKNGGIPLNESQTRKAEMEAYSGLQAVDDVNMNLGLMDFAQGIILVAPFGKLIGKLAPVIGGNKLASHLLGTTAKAPLEMSFEGAEEGIQYLVGEKYKKGEYDKYKGGDFASGYGENLNLLSLTTQGVLGLSHDALVNTPEFRNSFRSGLVIGGVLGGPVSIYESGKELNNYKNTKRDVLYNNLTKEFDPLVSSKIEEEEIATKIDRITNLHDKNRIRYINDIVDNADQYSQDITKEDIKFTKDLINKTVAAIKYVDNTKGLEELTIDENKASRSQAIKNIVHNEVQLNKLGKKISDLNKANSTIYSELVKEESDKQARTDVDKLRSELYGNLSTIQSSRLSNVLDFKAKLAKLEDEYKLELGRLKELDLSEEALTQQVALVKQDYESKIGSEEDLHKNIVKDLDSQISSLERNIRTLAFNHINISHPGIHAVNEAKNAQKSLSALIDTTKQLIAKDDESEDTKNTVEAKNRKEILSLLKDQNIIQELKEAKEKAKILQSVLPEDAKQSDIDAVDDRIEQVIDEIPVDKTEELAKNTNDITQFNNDIVKINSLLNKWKNNPNELLNDSKIITANYDVADNKDNIIKDQVAKEQAAAEPSQDIPETLNKEDIDVTDKPNTAIYENKTISIESPLRNVHDAIGYSHAISEKDIISRDKELSIFLSTFANKEQLNKAKVIFTIDKEELSRDTEWLTKYGKINIKIQLPNGKVFEKGLVMHTPQYVYNEKTDVSHLYIPSEETLSKRGFPSVKAYIEYHKNVTERNRKKIIEYLKNSNVTEVYTEGIDRTRGIHNNVDKRQGIYDAWKAKDGELKFYVANRDGYLESYVGDTMYEKALYTPGTVFAETDKTCNGSTALVHINSSKLTEEHAGILFDAIIAKVTKGGRNALFQDTNLKIGDVIEMLALEGYKYVLPAGATIENLNKQEQVRFNKQLWEETIAEDGKKNYVLHFGQNEIRNYNKLKGEELESAKNKFVEWATTYKTYPVRLNTPGLLQTKLKLNEPVTRSFKIGSWEYNYDESNPKTLGEILASVPVDGKSQYALNTDVEEFENTGSIFKDPVAMLTKEEDSLDLNIKTNLSDKSVKTKKQKVSPKQKQTVEESKPNEEGFAKIKTLKDLPVGTKVYIDLIDGVYSPLGEIGDNGSFISADIHTVSDAEKEIKSLPSTVSAYIKPSEKITIPTPKEVEKVEEVKEEVIEAVGIFQDVPEEDVQKVDIPETSSSILDITPEESEDPLNEFYSNNNPDAKPRLTNWAKPYYNKAEIKKEVEEIRRMLGKSFSIKIVDDFIKVAEQGKLAFATFERDLITLARMMEEGTGYHEALHRVTYLLLDPIDRSEIYRQAKTKYATKLKETYGDKKHTSEEIDEILAEEFRTYALSQASNKVSLFGPIKNLFDRILNWIKYYVFKRNPLSSTDIDSLFAALYAGKFRYAKINKDNYNKLGLNKVPRMAYLNDVPSIDSAEQLDRLVKSIGAYIILKQGYINLSDIKSIDWNLGKSYIQNRASNALAKSTKTDISEESRNNWIRLKELYTDMLKYWDTDFKPLMSDYFKSLDIKIKQTLSENSDEVKLDELEENQITRYDINPVEEDYKNKALPAIKFMVAVLRDSNNPDEFSGLYNYSSFDENWRLLLRELHHMRSYEEMYSKINELAKTERKWSDLKDMLDRSPKMTKNQFYQVMSKHRHSFLNLNVKLDKGEGFIAEHFFIDAQLQNESNNYINRKNGGLWGMDFLNSAIIRREKGKESRINLEEFNKLHKEYKDILADAVKFTKQGSEMSLTTLQNNFIDLLKKIRISIDNDTLDYILASKQGEDIYKKWHEFVSSASNLFNPKYSTIYKYQEWLDSGKRIKDATLEKLNISTVLANEKFVNDLAKDHVRAHLYKAGDMVYGPAGKPFFVYSENNIVSDTVYDINSSKEEVEKKLSAVNNKNSYILNKLLKSDSLRKAFRVVTFSAFNDENSSEDSLEYLGMNEIENYTMKMLAALSGYLPFPVLASKKLYYMFDGVKGFGLSKESNSAAIEKEGKIHFSDEVVDLFYGYFLDEKNRIEKVAEDVKKAVASGDLSNLTQYVHFIYDNKKNRIIFDESLDIEWSDKYIKGKVAGSRYVTFSDFNTSDIDVNDEVAVKKYIQDRLQKKLTQELTFATNDLKLISFKKGEYNNELLPTDLVLKYKESRFGFTSKNAIIAMFADSMINQMIGVVETEKLISGDPICYKPSKKDANPVDDQIKRLSVLSSTGAKGVTSMVDEYTDSNGQPYDKDLNSTQYTTMTLRSNVEDLFNNDLLLAHKAYYVSQGIEDSEALDLARGMLSKYSDTDTTDAQSFITPMMYRQIKMRLGEWDNNKQKAFEELMSDKELSKEELWEYRKFFMEPLKLAYFGHNLNNGLDTVTYDKMSLATLFPRDIKELQIENLYNNMISRGIHMVKFDSAIKAGVQDEGQFYNNDKESTFDYNKITTYKQDWKYLRRQLITDPHEEDHQKVGTQMIKITLSNIIKDSESYNIDGVIHTGEEVITNIFNSLKALSNSGSQKVFDKLGIDENGQVDDKLLIDWLKDEAVSGKMPHAVIESLFTEDGSKANSLDLLAKRDWIINRLISYISKQTVDITLPGKALVQQSNVGFRTGVNDELKFYQVSKGLVSMECMVSIGLFKNVIPNYKELTDEQRKDWVNSHPEILGYRIPTQGQSSIVALKVKKFLSESAGDVIILPREFTTLTGSDFDIDKLYAIRYNYKVEKGRSNIIKFFTKGKDYKNTHEGIIESEFREGKITKEEAEENVSKLDSFKTKYNAKIKELYARYRNTLADRLGDEFKALNDEIEAYYTAIDSTKAEINKLKKEADDLLVRFNSTHDISDLKLRSKILDNIENIRDEDGRYRDAAIDTVIRNKQTVLDMIAEGLIKEGKLKSKVDFLLSDEFEQNTEKAIQNRLISSMFAVIKSKDHVIHTTKPLDSLNQKLKDKAGAISKVTKKALGSLDRLTPLFQSKIKIQYGTGKMGVPFAALHNVHHSLAQAVGLGVYDTDVIGEDYIRDGKVIGKRLDIQKGQDGQFISDWINALLNAFVDIEKDPYIISLNINNTTYPTTYFLLRLGLGETTFDFMSQGVLKKLAKYDALSEGFMTEFENYSHAFNKLRKEVENNLFAALKEANIKTSDLEDKNVYDKEVLEVGKFSPEHSNLKGKELAQYWKNQLAVLDEFKKLKKKADLLQELVGSSQIDTKKYGSNMPDMKSFDNKLRGVLNEGYFINQDELFNDTHLSTLYQNSVKLVGHILNNKMIEYTKGFEGIYDRVLQMINKRFTGDSKMVNVITKEVYTQIISEFFTSKDYLGLTEDDISRLFYGEESIASRVYKIQKGEFLPNTTDRNRRVNKWLKERKIFTNLLMPEFPENAPSHLRVAYRKDSDINPDLIMESFKDLFANNEPEVKQLAKDLLIYSYFSSGRKMGVFSIFQHISPNEWSFLKGDNNISFNDFLKIKLEELQREEYATTDMNNIARSVIQNAWYFNSIVRPISRQSKKDDFGTPKQFIPDENIYKYQGKYPRAFRISNLNTSSIFIGDNKYNQPVYLPYVKSWLPVKEDDGTKFVQVLGEYIGYDVKTREPIYKVIPKRSISTKGNVVKENGLSVGRVFRDELPTDTYKLDSKDYIENTLNKKFGLTIEYIPLEDQVISDKMQDINKAIKISDKAPKLYEYINNLSDEDKNRLLEMYKKDNPSIETIGDILYEESENKDSKIAIKVLEHMLKC